MSSADTIFRSSLGSSLEQVQNKGYFLNTVYVESEYHYKTWNQLLIAFFLCIGIVISCTNSKSNTATPFCYIVNIQNSFWKRGKCVLFKFQKDFNPSQCYNFPLIYSFTATLAPASVSKVGYGHAPWSSTPQGLSCSWNTQIRELKERRSVLLSQTHKLNIFCLL